MEDRRYSRPIRLEVGIAWEKRASGRRAEWCIYRRVQGGELIHLHQGVVELPFAYSDKQWADAMAGFHEELDFAMKHYGWIIPEVMRLDA